MYCSVGRSSATLPWSFSRRDLISKRNPVHTLESDDVWTGNFVYNYGHVFIVIFPAQKPDPGYVQALDSSFVFFRGVIRKMATENSQPTKVGATSNTRKPYQKPKLEVLGDLRSFVLGGSPGANDSGSFGTRKPPTGMPEYDGFPPF